MKSFHSKGAAQAAHRRLDGTRFGIAVSARRDGTRLRKQADGLLRRWLVGMLAGTGTQRRRLAS